LVDWSQEGSVFQRQFLSIFVPEIESHSGRVVGMKNVAQGSNVNKQLYMVIRHDSDTNFATFQLKFA
jgi:hypothetical protein